MVWLKLLKVNIKLGVEWAVGTFALTAGDDGKAGPQSPAPCATPPRLLHRELCQLEEIMPNGGQVMWAKANEGVPEAGSILGAKPCWAPQMTQMIAEIGGTANPVALYIRLNGRDCYNPAHCYAYG